LAACKVPDLIRIFSRSSRGVKHMIMALITATTAWKQQIDKIAYENGLRSGCGEFN